MKKVAGLLKRRFENIITYLTHPITNATSESINAKIQWVKYTARGFDKPARSIEKPKPLPYHSAKTQN
jgi:transposase